MNVETDKDVFGYVKDTMRYCRFSDPLEICFACPFQNPNVPDDYYRFNIKNIEELPGKLFDFSLSKRVSEIYSFPGHYYGHVDLFEIHFSESSDFQTNITPRMIDFFRLIVDPFSRDTLVEALKPKPQPMEDDYLNWDGRFIIAPVETNPWYQFE